MSDAIVRLIMHPAYVHCPDCTWSFIETLNKEVLDENCVIECPKCLVKFRVVSYQEEDYADIEYIDEDESE